MEHFNRLPRTKRPYAEHLGIYLSSQVTQRGNAPIILVSIIDVSIPGSPKRVCDVRRRHHANIKSLIESNQWQILQCERYTCLSVSTFLLRSFINIILGGLKQADQSFQKYNGQRKDCALALLFEAECVTSMLSTPRRGL